MHTIRRPATVRQTLRDERGYTLVSLLALMTILAISMMAVVPSVRHQAQREKELEAIRRGEEVAEAIRLYVRYHPQHVLPTSMDQLIEGVQVPGRTKKLQVLRATAARDPLSTSGEWRLIRVDEKAMIEFKRSLLIYAEGKQPLTRDPFLQQFALRVPALRTVLDIEEQEAAPCKEDATTNPKGPFIGVASRNTCNSIIAYYGIERYDQWVFTPLFR